MGFTEQFRNARSWVGYWSVMNCSIAAERIARVGYDYMVIDLQHGLFDTDGLVRNIVAIDCWCRTAPIVRVESNDFASIGRVLDAGARGVIVPMVNSESDAIAAVQAAKYPPSGKRSFGPTRARLRIGPDPADANSDTVVILMIETAEALANIDAIASVEGVDAIYVGPKDLSISLGSCDLAEPLETVVEAARSRNIVAGMHTFSGAEAAQYLLSGFQMVSIASDVAHLEIAASTHLEAARRFDVSSGGDGSLTGGSLTVGEPGDSGLYESTVVAAGGNGADVAAAASVARLDDPGAGGNTLGRLGCV